MNGTHFLHHPASEYWDTISQAVRKMYFEAVLGSTVVNGNQEQPKLLAVES